MTSFHMSGKVAVIQALQSYFDAWNAHDVHAFLDNLSENCTYKDDSTAVHLNREEAGAHMERLLSSMPDLHVDVKTLSLNGQSEVEAQWVFNSHNISIPVKGKILLDGAKIEKVECRFDNDFLQKEFGLK